MTRTRKSKRPAPMPPFTARRHLLDADSVVELRGDHFMTVATFDGATMLADILNKVAELDYVSHLLADGWIGRMKIAGAVAKALGGSIDHESFQPAQAENPRRYASALIAGGAA